MARARARGVSHVSLPSARAARWRPTACRVADRDVQVLLVHGREGRGRCRRAARPAIELAVEGVQADGVRAVDAPAHRRTSTAGSLCVHRDARRGLAGPVQRAASGADVDHACSAPVDRARPARAGPGRTGPARSSAPRSARGSRPARAHEVLGRLRGVARHAQGEPLVDAAIDVGRDRCRSCKKGGVGHACGCRGRGRDIVTEADPLAASRPGRRAVATGSARGVLVLQKEAPPNPASETDHVTAHRPPGSRHRPRRRPRLRRRRPVGERPDEGRHRTRGRRASRMRGRRWAPSSEALASARALGEGDVQGRGRVQREAFAKRVRTRCRTPRSS